MNKKFYVVLIVLLTGFCLAACTRSLAKSEKAVSTNSVEGNPAMPASGTEVMGQIYLLATQTAMVQQGSTSQQPETEQVTEEVLTSTPETEVTVTEESSQPEDFSPPPPNPEQIVVPSPTPGKPETYVIQKGEFAYCIARRFDVNPHELLRVNGIPPETTLQPGTELRLPEGDRGYPGNRALREHPTTYSVNPEDTIYSIACLFGDADPNAIAYANNLTHPYTLTAGQEIYIP